MWSEESEIIREAKKEAKFDFVKNFFKRHCKAIKYFSISILCMLLIFASFQAFNYYSNKKYSSILHQVIVDEQIGNADKVKSGLSKISSSSYAPGNIKILATMRYAPLLFAEGKKDEALTLYQKSRECYFCDPYLRDLVGLVLVQFWMNDDSELKKEDLSFRIKKISNSAGPLKYYIEEQRGFLELSRSNLEESHKIFQAISKLDDPASSTLKQRAIDSMSIIESRGLKTEGVKDIKISDESSKSSKK